MSRAVNYFVKAQQSASGELTELCQIATRYVPALLGSVQGWKARSFWVDTSSWEDAYNHLSAQQAELLMGAKEDIVREIRGVRGGQPGVVTDDLTTYPIGTFPGIQLRDIHLDLNDAGSSAAQKLTSTIALLTEIRDNLAAQGNLDEDMLAQLIQIAGFLAA